MCLLCFLVPFLVGTAITTINVLEENPDLTMKLAENIPMLWQELLDFRGLSVASPLSSVIVFLRTENSTGSLENDSHLIEDIADRRLNEGSVFVVVFNRSTLDECRLPVVIKLFVSTTNLQSNHLALHVDDDSSSCTICVASGCFIYRV